MKTSLSALLMLLAVPATAFEFEEHAQASQLALDAVVTMTEDGWDAAENDARAWLSAASRRDVKREIFCQERTTHGAECLQLSDVTGVTGDLVSDPGVLVLYLKNRNDNLADVDFVGNGVEAVGLLGEYKTKLDREGSCQRMPTGVRQDRGLVNRLAKLVHKDAKNNADKCARHYEMENVWLSINDGDLAPLAARNCSHFEILGVTPEVPASLDGTSFAQVFAPVTMADPTWCPFTGSDEHWPVAAQEGAWPYYLDLHGLAVLLAEVATTADGLEATRYRSFALIAELMALHYLQDLYAPGHRLTDKAAGRHGATRREQHNRKNSEGDVPRMRDVAALCQAIEGRPMFADISKRCGSESLPALYGDTGLRCTGDTEELLRRQLLGAISWLSLEELTKRRTASPTRRAALDELKRQWSTDIKMVLPNFHGNFFGEDLAVQAFIKASEVWQTGKLDDVKSHPKLDYLAALADAEQVFRAVPLVLPPVPAK